MLKRTLSIILSLAVCGAALASCSNSSSSNESGEENTSTIKLIDPSSSEEEEEELPTTDEGWNAAMLERSLVSYGNVNPIQEKIARAQGGEEITIGYLGGSITEGYTVKPDECYASLSYNIFKNMYGTGDNVKYCNAGLSGTPSRLGILRMQRDLLSSNPDIVFIEYAVNDGMDYTYQEAYESIIRTLLERNIAVILLFSVTEDDYSAEDYMKDLGTYYDLPMISYCDALRFLFKHDRMKWSDFSNDGSHPNPDGHKLVASMIENYFKTVTDKHSDGYTIPEEPKNMLLSYGAEMYEGDTLSADSLGSWKQGDTDVASFNNGWRHIQGSDEPITFTITGKNLFLIYKEVGGGNYGNVEVSYTTNEDVTGEVLVEPVTSDGWGNPQVKQIASNDKELTYYITVKPISGDEDKSFQILGWAATK